MASLGLSELAKTHAVDIHWRSFELRPTGSPPISPAYLARIEAGRPRLYAVAHEQYGVKMNQGPFGQNSRPALIAAKYAEEQGVGAAYHDALLRGYWTQARAIESVDDLAQFANDIGLDPAGVRAALDDPTYEALVDADIQQAAAYGLSGVPAIVFENQYLISGAQPVATLRQVCDRIMAEKAGSA